MHKQPSVQQVNEKLRAIRLSKSLSLADVQALSLGEIKAVVLGSYERGTRAMSVRRALQIAILYQVPISEFFGQPQPFSSGPEGRTILDLRLINHRAQQEDRHNLPRYNSLLTLLQQIIRMRQDWNGEVISLRRSDVGALAMLFTSDDIEVLSWLGQEGLVLKLN